MTAFIRDTQFFGLSFPSVHFSCAIHIERLFAHSVKYNIVQQICLEDHIFLGSIRVALPNSYATSLSNVSFQHFEGFVPPLESK